MFNTIITRWLIPWYEQIDRHPIAAQKIGVTPKIGVTVNVTTNQSKANKILFKSFGSMPSTSLSNRSNRENRFLANKLMGVITVVLVFIDS